MACSVPNPQPEIYPHGYPVPRRWDAPACLRLWHLGSLDAPTVAVVWTLAFACALRVTLPPGVSVGIGLAAWSFYIGDRLLDAHTARSPLRPRHFFHWKHRRVFLTLAVTSAVAAFTLVLHFMPVAARARNSALAAATVAYFLSVHSPWRLVTRRIRLRIPKELLVGILFTMACAASAWTRIAGHRVSMLVPIACFIALAWLNCHAIESWESNHKRSRHAAVFPLAMALAGAALLAAAVYAALHLPRIAALLAAAALSAIFLAILDRARPRLTSIALRAAADLVLLTPLALLAVA